MSIKDRKKDHVRLCLDEGTTYRKSAGFESYDFIHNALPEINYDKISTQAQLLDRTFAFPLFISSMTGGYAEGGSVNSTIAKFCQRNNLPFGVGSQRVMLEKPEEIKSFSIVREYAPDAFIAANIGGSQLSIGLSEDDITLLKNSISANAIIVHLNPLQELMQPEGDTVFSGILKAIEKLAHHVDVPVMVKETGAGISGSTAQLLYNAGVKVIDVAGAGGTSWSKVENARTGVKDSLFDEWGIPTVECITSIKALELPDLQLIASGGIRNSLHIAKALCLGATFTASAQPVIQAVMKGGEEQLQELYDSWNKNLRIMMCLLGTRSIKDLNDTHLRLVK